jgi:hypothetical protein
VLERALSMRPDFDAARALLATLRSPES